MEKLTLSVDGAVVIRAKRYAAARGTSVSQLVETMLQMVSSGKTPVSAEPPVLARMKGSLKRGSEADYAAHLRKKHL
jgi:hypothetical protein